MKKIKIRKFKEGDLICLKGDSWGLFYKDAIAFIVQSNAGHFDLLFQGEHRIKASMHIESVSIQWLNSSTAKLLSGK